MEVLCLCSYPIESAATRYRLIQYVEPLAQRGINLTISPFLQSPQFANFYSKGGILSKTFGMVAPLTRRVAETLSLKKYDAIIVQREAMMFGPAFFEWLASSIWKKPIILDLDDATYVRYKSPTFGAIGSALKFFGKTDALIDRSEIVLCGNRFIAEYVTGRNKKAFVIPTIVDTEKFCPLTQKDLNRKPVIGWIGTHSTFHAVESLFPVLSNLAKKYDFTLKIVGAGRTDIEIEGVKVENVEWKLEREVADFQSLDIGLYPIEISENGNQEWMAGKSGFKAIQYLSVGIPYVVTPIGVCAEIGSENETHFTAKTPGEWSLSLEKLLRSAEIRSNMGVKGREYALRHYTISQQTAKLEGLIREAVK